MLKPGNFFDLSKSDHHELFDEVEYVWEALKLIPDYLAKKIEPAILGLLAPSVTLGEDVYVGAGTVVEPGVVIKGPAIIGSNCEIRAGAYIRQNVIIGDGVVVGHSSELKNCLLFNEVSVPHFNYVGDSILGWRAHLGAGVKISNYKINGTQIEVKLNGRRIKTGLLKFGAILGDEAEIGCNAVLNPGTLVGKRTLVYANTSLYGYIPPASVVKLRQSLEIGSRE